MMIYWEYILISAVFLYAVGNIFHRLRKIRYDYFHKTAVRNILSKIESDRSSSFFNSDVLRRSLVFLYRQKNPKARRAMLNLVCGKITPAAESLRQHQLEYFAEILKAFRAPKAAIKKLSDLNSPEAAIEQAVLQFCQGKLAETEKLIEQIPDKGLNSYSKARKRFCQGYIFLNDGDMLSASQCAAEAGNLFNKSKAYFEEAQCYLLSGTIYRLSGIEDVAKFMFDAATKIFSGYGDDAGNADTLGNCGMLWVLQEKSAEAECDFGKALEINRRLNRRIAEAGILNQLALTNLLDKKLDTAKKRLKESEKINRELNNHCGLAFCFELSAHVFHEQKNYTQASACAAEAQKLYRDCNNISARFESLYLQALAEFEGENPQNAEQILRGLIAEAKIKKSAFHTASAYNLMGLIFLKYSKSKEAKVWFQEAAALEQKNDRYSGAAADYANIGLIEKRRGNLEQARKNLETAIGYAEIYGETELSETLRQRLKNLKI